MDRRGGDGGGDSGLRGARAHRPRASRMSGETSCWATSLPEPLPGSDEVELDGIAPQPRSTGPQQPFQQLQPASWFPRGHPSPELSCTPCDLHMSDCPLLSCCSFASVLPSAPSPPLWSPALSPVSLLLIFSSTSPTLQAPPPDLSRSSSGSGSPASPTGLAPLAQATSQHPWSSAFDQGALGCGRSPPFGGHSVGALALFWGA